MLFNYDKVNESFCIEAVDRIRINKLKKIFKFPQSLNEKTLYLPFGNSSANLLPCKLHFLKNKINNFFNLLSGNMLLIMLKENTN